MAYERVVNGVAAPDATWVEAEDLYGQLGVVMREMTQGGFRIGSVDYTCTVLPESASYEKGDCEVLFSSGDMTVGYEPGDYARLGGAGYRLDCLSPDGRFLRLVATSESEDPESTQIGFKPYAFTATDIEGRTIRFPEDFAGKYVLLDFWSTGCGPCCKEIRDLYPGVYARYKGAGLERVLRRYMPGVPELVSGAAL